MLLCFSFLFCSLKLTRYKHYERWATANDFPVENVVNDGSTTLEDRLGAVADLELVIRSRKLQDDVMVVRAVCVRLIYLIVTNNFHHLLYRQHFSSVWADCWRHAVCRPKLWRWPGYPLLQIKGETFQSQVYVIYLSMKWQIMCKRLSPVCGVLTAGAR